MGRGGGGGSVFGWILVAHARRTLRGKREERME